MLMMTVLGDLVSVTFQIGLNHIRNCSEVTIQHFGQIYGNLMMVNHHIVKKLNMISLENMKVLTINQRFT